MPAYVIVNVKTSDPEKYDGRYLVRGGEMNVLEGSWKPTRIVVLEFDSYERANAWWHSQEYAPAKELRQRLSTTDLLIVDGFEQRS